MAAAYTIGYDAVTTYDFGHSGNGSWVTSSGTHTCADSGGNTIVIAEVYGDSEYYRSDFVNITYNSAPLVYSGMRAGNGYSGYVHIYYLINATSGAHTFSGSLWMNGDIAAKIVVKSYTGVSKLNPIDSSATNSAYHTSPPALTTLAVSTDVVKENCWLLGCFLNWPAGSTPPYSNKTDRSVGSVNYLGFRYCSSDTNGTVGTGSQSITWTHSNDWPIYCGGVVYSIAPATSAEEFDTITVAETVAIDPIPLPQDIILVDSTVTGGSGEVDEPTLTVPITIGQHDNRLVLVSIGVDKSGSLEPALSYARFDGQDMTLLGSQYNNSYRPIKVFLYYFLAPAVGTYNITTHCTNSSMRSFGLIATSLYNVNQDNIPDAVITSTQGSGTPTNTLTTVAEKCSTYLATQTIALVTSVSANAAILGQYTTSPYRSTCLSRSAYPQAFPADTEVTMTHSLNDQSYPYVTVMVSLRPIDVKFIRDIEEPVHVDDTIDLHIPKIPSVLDDIHVDETSTILIPILVPEVFDTVHLLDAVTDTERYVPRHLQIETNIYQPRASL